MPRAPLNLSENSSGITPFHSRDKRTRSLGNQGTSRLALPADSNPLRSVAPQLMQQPNPQRVARDWRRTPDDANFPRALQPSSGPIKRGALKVHVVHGLGPVMNTYFGINMLYAGLYRIGRQDKNPGHTLGCVALPVLRDVFGSSAVSLTGRSLPSIASLSKPDNPAFWAIRQRKHLFRTDASTNWPSL